MWLNIIIAVKMAKTDKQAILGALRGDPMGLTVQDISRQCKVSRVTAAIYVHELMGEGKVVERKVGAYKLFRIKSGRK